MDGPNLGGCKEGYRCTTISHIVEAFELMG